MRVPGTGSAPRLCSGKRKRKPSSPREYLCVWRLRRRRLLAFLSTHGFNSTFQALVQETSVFFSVAHLQRLVRLAKWGEAIAYASRFVPNKDALGQEGSVFFSFLDVHRVIHTIAVRAPNADALTGVYERELVEHPDPDIATVKLISMVSALNRRDNLRNSINWHLVRCQAAEIAEGLIARTPEFNHLVRLPNCRDKPHTILPIRSCSHPRRHVKKIGPIPVADVAKFYLQKKRSLLSLSRCEGSSLGLSLRAAEVLANLIDHCVRAGMNRSFQVQHPSEVSCNKVHPDPAVPNGKRESSAFCNNSVMEVSVSAKRKQVRHPLEYPCVSRLRHRRLLAYLRRRSSGSTFNAFVCETNVFFSIMHLHRLVCLGHWDDAIKYVSRFVPSLEMLGSEGIVFFNFLQVHKALQSIADGESRGALLAEERERNLKKYPNSDQGTVKLTRVLLTMLRCKQLRGSIDWSCMRFKAAEIVKDLITKTPEFNDLLRLPNCRDKPHNILPIGSCSHQRHHIKERGQTPASDIAKLYLQKKRSLPSSSHSEGNSVVLGLSSEESAWLAEIVVQSVQAGVNRVVLKGHSFQDSCKEVQSLQAGVNRVVLKGHSFQDSCNEGMKHTVIAGYSGRQVTFARNNPIKRPLTTVCQEFNPKRQQISGEFCQHAGPVFEAHHWQGNARVVRP